MHLIKADTMGETLWTKTYGGSDLDIGWSVRQNADSGFTIAGETRSSGAGLSDIYFIRTDSNGETLCVRVFGGSEEDAGHAAQETSIGRFIIGGYTASIGAGMEDVYLLLLDPFCDTLATKTYGGSASDVGYSTREASDMGFVIAGYTASFGAGSLDVYLIKTDSLLDTAWTKSYGGTLEDQGQSVQQTTDGGYVVAGFTESFGEGSFDVYLIKTDSLGNTLWTKTYGGILDDRGYSVYQTSDEGYIITGYTESFGEGNKDVWLIKTDSQGETLWTCTYGDTSDDWDRSVQETSDGFYIFTGYTASSGAGNRDIYLIKADSCGVVGIEEEKPVYSYPFAVFNLLQNRPNPFHSSTTIQYTLPEFRGQGSGVSGKIPVHLATYDIAGRLIETLVDDHQEPGVYQVEFEGKNQPSGIYFYRFQAGDYISTKKMILLH